MPAFALPALFVMIWSTGYVAAGFVIQHADPLTFLSVRYAVAFAVLAPVCLLLGARPPSTARGWLHGLLSGALLHGVYQGANWWGIQHGVPAGMAALIGALQPVFTAIAAGPFAGERLSATRWAGVALGFLGVAAVVEPKLAGSFSEFGWPVAAALFATLSITVATLHQKRALPDADLKSLAPVQFLGAIAVMAPTAWLIESGRFDLVPMNFALLGWTVVVLSIVATFMIMTMVARGDVSRVAALVFLVPPITSIYAYLALGETLAPIQIGGMGLAAVGVFLANRDGGEAASAPSAAKGRA